MDDVSAILVMVLTIIICSVIAHVKIKSVVRASLVASLAACIIIAVIDYIELGYVGIFSSIVIPSAFGLSFIGALIIGIPFSLLRKEQYNKSLKERDALKRAP